MTGAHWRSLAPLLPEEDTVILLTEKNNTIHHLLLSPHLSLPLCLGCYAVLLCFCLCPTEGFEASPSPLDASVRLNYLLKLISDPGWGEIILKDVIYPDLSSFFTGNTNYFTSISAYIRLSHPRQPVASEQDRPSHGAINIYPAHSSSSYCSAAVWRARISFTQQVCVVISSCWQ